MSEHPQFVMSMYANKEALLRAKAEYYMDKTAELEARIELAHQCNRTAMPGFIGDALRGDDLNGVKLNDRYTLREYMDAVDKEDAE